MPKHKPSSSSSAFPSLLPSAALPCEMLHKKGEESRPAHVCRDRHGPAPPLLFLVSVSLQGNSFITQISAVPFSSLTPTLRSVHCFSAGSAYSFSN